MQLSVDQCPDGSPTHCTLVACYWVGLLIWDRGLHSCLLGQRYSAFSSPPELQLSIQHSKPKAGNWLAGAKLYELSMDTGVCSSSVSFCVLHVHVYVQRSDTGPGENCTTASSCTVSYPYIRALIEAKRLLVSCPSVLAQPLPSLHHLLLFLVSLLPRLPPPSASPNAQSADRGMAQSQTPGGRLSQTDWLCNNSLARWLTSSTHA